MTRTDPRGLPLTVAGDAAADAYEAALQDYLHYRGDPLAAARAVARLDSAMPMARVLEACLLLLTTEGRQMAAARAAVDAARALAAGATEGERRHIAALGLWLAGQGENAARLLEAHLIHAPRDLLALAIGHYLRFFLGQVEEQRDIVARALPAWDEAMADYGQILALHAFGLNETGHHEEAEETGRRAVARDGDDNYAIHAVAHALEARSQVAAGLAWLDAHEGVWAQGNFAVHMAWHKTLLLLEQGDTAACLDVHDRLIRRVDSDWAVDLNDATALLWRLDLAGIDTGGRWGRIANHWESLADGRTYVFNDMHAAMAFAATGRFDALARLSAALGEGLRREGDNGRTIRRIGAEVVAALEAFGRGLHGEAARRLFAVRARAPELGCSRLQQGVLTLTLVEAALRDGDADMALAVLAERRALDPQRASLAEQQARAARLRGDRATAQDAERIAAALRSRDLAGRAA